MEENKKYSIEEIKKLNSSQIFEIINKDFSKLLEEIKLDDLIPVILEKCSCEEKVNFIEYIFSNKDIDTDIELFFEYIDYIEDDRIIDYYMFKKRKDIVKRVNKRDLGAIIENKLYKNDKLSRLLISYFDVSKKDGIFYLELTNKLLNEKDVRNFITYMVEQGLTYKEIISNIRSSENDDDLKLELADKVLEILMDSDLIIEKNIINEYIKLFKNDTNATKEKLKEFLSSNYKYKEVFYLEIASIELAKINKMIIDGNDVTTEYDYVLNILRKAEISAKNNFEEDYLLEIYEKEIEIYGMSDEEKDIAKTEEIRANRNKIIRKKEQEKRAEEDRKIREERRIDQERKAEEEKVLRERRRIEQQRKAEEEKRIKEEIKRRKKEEKSSNFIIKILFLISLILLITTVGVYILRENKQSSNSKPNDTQQEELVKTEDINNKPKERKKESNNENQKSENQPTVKKSLPTRNSEYGDYDSDTQTYFMQIENLLTEYYKNYEKAVSSADYSYVRDDLVDNGQLAKELRKSIPTYKHKSVYVKHFSIYNFEMNYDYDVATFNLDTVFIVDENRIQIETQKMTVNFNYHKSAWEIDNYTDWEIVYKQSYDPDKDYFDFTNYRDYF